MRHLGALATVLALVLPASVAFAVESADYRDDFGSGGYAGNDGSLDFDGPWSEFGDSGGAGSGLVHVGEEYCSNNECLHIEGPGLISTNFGVQRAADLGSFEFAELSFDIFVETDDSLGLTLGELRVQVRSEGQWTTLGSYDLKTSFKSSKVYDVSGFLSEDFAIRFLVPGLLGAKVANWIGYATVDRVAVKGSLGSASTTSSTSTTRPKFSTSSSTSTSSTTSTTPQTTSTTASRSASTTRVAVVSSGGADGTTTTTVSETTTTTTDTVLGLAPTPPPDGGVRDPGVGLITDYEPGMMGDMDMDGVDVLGAELEADFSLAVEYFEAGKLWIALLALLIGAAFVGGLDRWRLGRESV